MSERMVRAGEFHRKQFGLFPMKASVLQPQGRRDKLSHFWADREFLWVIIVAVIVCTLPSAICGQDAASPHEEFLELRDTLYRIPSYTGGVNQIRQQLQSGNSSRALVLIQALLDKSEDAFVVSEKNERVYSLRAELNRLLDRQPPAVMAEYEKTMGGSARLFLQEAINSDDDELLAKVLQRFLHTRAGFEAVQLTARRMLDRGDADSSVRLLQRVENSTAHRGRVNTRDFQMLKSIALAASGQTIAADQVLAEGNWSAEQMQRIRLLADNRPGESDDEWNNTFGNSSRNKNSAASAPWLQPKWSVNLFRDPLALKSVIETWRKSTTVRTPVIANNTLAVRELDHIRGYDLSSGRELWTFRCDYSILDELDVFSTRGRGRDTKSLLYDGVVGTLSTDGVNVYAIDTVSVRVGSRSVASVMSRTGGSTKINRLLALPLQANGPNQPAWVAGGTFSLPSWFIERDRNRDQLVSISELGDDRLFARLDRNSDDIVTVDEAIEGNTNQSVLADHFFLGPPLPVNGRLYCVTESGSRLNVVALDAETGDVLWVQGIAFSNRAIGDDLDRQRFACTPSYANGILVCPTNNDVLVALDAFDGSLLWGGFHGTIQDSFRALRRRIENDDPIGDGGFPTAPVIAGGRVYYRPRFDKRVHCFDLYSGNHQWTSTTHSDRNRIDQCVATATDDTIFIIGNSFCRGLNTADGSERWLSPMPFVGGQGIRSGSNYLLPVTTGRVLTIDIATGGQVGYSRSHEDFANSTVTGSVNVLPRRWSPGNLAAAGPWLVSTRTDRIDVLPQAGEMLRLTQQRLANRAPAPRDELLIAELNLAMGKLEPAKVALQQLLAHPGPASVESHAESLMRELLYLALSKPSPDEHEILAELSRYSRTSNDRARYLIHQSRFDLKSRDLKHLLATTLELQQLATDKPLSLNANGHHQVSVAAWTNGMIEQIRETADSASLASLSVDYRREYARIRSAGDPIRLLQFARSTGTTNDSREIRLNLAQRLSELGEYQQAEFLLLQNIHRDNSDTAQESILALSRLWSRLGLSNAAFLLLDEFELQDPLNEERRAILASARRSLESTSDGRLASARAKRLPFDVTSAAFELNADANGDLLRDSYEPGFLVQFPLLGRAFQVIPRNPRAAAFDDALDDAIVAALDGASVSDNTFSVSVNERLGLNTTHLAVLDTESGATVGRIHCPPSYSLADEKRNPRNPSSGHFFAIGLHGRVRGVSLLNGDVSIPAWETGFDELGLNHDDSESLQTVGPAGPGFCSFQTRNSLTVLDPFDGSLLWSRSDIPAGSGLIRHPTVGLFGDEHVIVLLASDNQTYTVYRTSNGEKLRESHLLTAALMPRFVLGRKLMFVAGTGNSRRFRIWDPLKDEFEFDFAVDPNTRVPLYNRLPTGELVTVLEESRVAVYDAEKERFVTRLHLPDVNWAEVSDLTGFREKDTLYIGLNRKTFNVDSPLVAFTRANPITTATFNGEILAIDRQTGALKWRRQVSKRAFVETPHYNLPFLISLSYLTVRSNRMVDFVSVELIDKKTGRTFAREPGFRMDRPVFVRVNYDPNQRVIQLKSVPSGKNYRNSEITIRFNQLLQTGADGPAPL